MSNLLADESISAVCEWFSQFGPTDYNYLRSHYGRYLQTREFAISAPEKLSILDVGAHWLHNAFFYANQGHSVTCVDAPATLKVRHVIEAACAMQARLISNGSMERADGLLELADNSVDLVLFCEIIEHLAFNPIRFWKQVYRILKPGGRIIVTTPNVFYFQSLRRDLDMMLSGRTYGLTVSEIMSTGTYGHHWKEFSLHELKSYFSFLSADFSTDRHLMVIRQEDVNMPIDGALEGLIGSLADVRAHNIFLEVILKGKHDGILVSAPWENE